MSTALASSSGVPFAASTPRWRGLGRVLAGSLAIVAAFDVCFWKLHSPGLSVAVFFGVLAGAIAFNRTRAQLTRESGWILALLAGALIESGVESGFCNLVSLLALTLALAGHTFYRDVDSRWGRGLSQVVAMVRAPGRILWLGMALLEAGFSGEVNWVGGVAGAVLVATPALVLVLIFGSLLASGNAVFGAWTGNVFNWIWANLTFDLDPLRMALWFMALLLALPLLRPVQVAAWWWSWTERLPRLPDLVPHRAALGSSGLILIGLNGLFFVANTADTVFLWNGFALPAGVNYAEYVHQGVNTLIFTVLLSAVVLTGIFQQTPAVAGRRGLQILAFVWIAQNMFLLVGVARRLKLYIDAYDMTIERLGVIIFLVLVAAGYALLSLKIARCKSLSWLVGGCVLAVFATLYLTQFLNLAGWTAEHNMARWERDKSRSLDIGYLVDLGPAAWPALRRANDGGVAWDNPTSPLQTARGHDDAWPRDRFDSAHWREFSLRAWWNRAALEESKKMSQEGGR